jgi:tetratricopeptide (TPR) repeat protein
MRRLHFVGPSFTAARIEMLATFLVIGVLSLALGLWIPRDQRALLVTLMVATIGVAVVVATLPSWFRRWSGRPTHADTATARQPEPGTAPRPYLVPRELPPGPADFVGRTREIAGLQDAIQRDRDGEPFTAVIYGAPGIGKSALAITFAHTVASSFRDGQLFVRMRGTGEQREMTDDDLIEYFVTALRDPADRLPADPKEFREKYAELTRDRSVLFVLDDVPPSLDITALRPASPQCGFIVTCRDRPEWPEARCEMLALEALELPDALEMLRTAIGPDRVNKEKQSSRDLVSLCGRQPQALRAAGTAVANRPDWDIQLILEQAQSTPGRLASDQPHGGNFDAAYSLLTTDERQALRALGVLDASDFAPWMLAAALNTDEATGGRLASRLADAGLIERYSPGSGTPSYRAEDTVLAYALLRANAEDAATEPGHLRHLVEEAQNRPDRGLPDERIATLDELLTLYNGYTPAIDKVRNAMSRAHERSSRVGEAEACAALAELYADLGDMIAAEDLAQRAVSLGDRAARADPGQPAVKLLADHSLARALRCLVRIERRRHRLNLAVQHADRATKHAGQAGDQPEQVRILQEKAVVLARQGASAEADRVSLEALRTCESLGDDGESLIPGVRWCRGSVLLHAHHYDDAARVLEDGKQAAADQGQTRMGAWIEQVSACVAFAVHDLDRGEEHATEGLDAFTSLRHRYGTAHCRYQLGQVYNGRGDSYEAVRSLREALETFRNCADMWIEGEVSLELADAYRRQGRVHDAIRLQRAARSTYHQMDGQAQARQATWAMLRTLLTAPLPHRFREPISGRSRPAVT